MATTLSAIAPAQETGFLRQFLQPDRDLGTETRFLKPHPIAQKAIALINYSDML